MKQKIYFKFEMYPFFVVLGSRRYQLTVTVAVFSHVVSRVFEGQEEEQFVNIRHFFFSFQIFGLIFILQYSLYDSMLKQQSRLSHCIFTERCSPLAAFFQGTFIFSLVKYKPLKFNNTIEYPWWGYALGWWFTLSSTLNVPICMVYNLITTPGTLRQVTF